MSTKTYFWPFALHAPELSGILSEPQHLFAFYRLLNPQQYAKNIVLE